MTRIAIWGLGAIGSAMAEQLSRTESYEVLGFDINPVTIREALAAGVVQRAFNPAEINVLPIDLLVVAVPPTETMAVLRDLQTNNLVVDVASIKQPIMQVADHLPHFVGGHPMAGTDETGLIGRKKVKFDQASFFLVGNDADCGRIMTLLSPLGSHFETIDAAKHDVLIALTSDATHLIAQALVATLGGNMSEGARPFIGPGFRDTTRIAAANPELWTQILLANRVATTEAVTNFMIELQRLRELLVDNDAEQLLAALTAIQQIRRELA
ncbi:prephenate dehydrogenase [Weissella cibaria]|uniref:prephenate dehydrogenase n=1 Tax=Weissella cibaria TaxID=137591 RepID=UPI00189C2368|nr:prephenate dehydrogenase/arogenate dehydrogenase family protein [Weissella cibaria]